VRTPSRAWPWSYFKGAFTLDHCLAMDDGARECLTVARKKVRGVSLAEVMAGDPAGRPALMAVLDRAVLRQTAGVGAADAPAKRRTM
jgi:hypothetical protein